jgi:hypothetical protein
LLIHNAWFYVLIVAGLIVSLCIHRLRHYTIRSIKVALF